MEKLRATSLRTAAMPWHVTFAALETYSKEIKDDGLGKTFQCSLCPPGYSHLDHSRVFYGDTTFVSM